MTGEPPILAEPPAINPVVIQRFHGDLTAGELGAIRAALDRVPGDELGRRVLWEKFERNQAVLLIQRNVAGEIATFAFYEIRVEGDRREFYVSGACALLATRTATEESLPQYERFAKMLECDRLRFQTPRPGLVKKAIKAGWNLSTSNWLSREFVIFKNL